MRAPRGPKVGGGVMYRKGRADRQGGGSQVLVLVALGLVILTLGALWAGLNAPGSHRPQAAESTNRTVSEPEGELPLSEEEEELGPLDREPENSPEALIIKEGVMASAIKGSALPFLYGTAWKKERTTDLVVQARAPLPYRCLPSFPPSSSRPHVTSSRAQPLPLCIPLTQKCPPHSAVLFRRCWQASEESTPPASQSTTARTSSALLCGA